MKASIVLIAMIIVSSCAELDVQPEYKIHPGLTVYVDRFFDEAQSRSKIFQKQNLIVILRKRLIVDEGTFGLSFNEGSQRVILIDQDYYDTYRDSKYTERLEFMVFHELGHTILNRSHNTLDNSIMNGKGCLMCDQYLKNRQVLVDELFQ